MTLQIKIEGSPLSVSPTKLNQSFSHEGGTIGRSSACAWVLDDPERFLSGSHCELYFSGSGYMLTDTSTNGTFLNGNAEPIGKGNSVPLNNGDLFEVGDYKLRVSVSDAQAAPNSSSASVFDDPFAASGSDSPFNDFGSSPSDPFAAGSDPFGAASPPAGGDPLAGMFSADPEADQSDPLAMLDRASNQILEDGSSNKDIFAPSGGSMSDAGGIDQAISWPNSSHENQIPEDWGSDLDLSVGDTGGGESSGFADALDDLGPFPSSSGLQQEPPVVPDGREPFSDSLLSRAEGSPAHTTSLADNNLGHKIPDSEGLESIFGSALSSESIEQKTDQNLTSPVDEWSGEPAGQKTSDVLGAQAQVQPIPPQARKPQSQKPPSQKPPSQKPPSHKGVVNDVLIDAMGLRSDLLDDEQKNDIHRQVGELMRDVVSGMMQMLRSRASIKNEFRMDVTTIQPAENNPLKFSVDVDEALENMFVRKSSAYKNAEQAFNEGFSGIAEHQMAIIAGIREAFEGMISRFDPERLEEQFSLRSSKGSLIPGSKAAKNWTNYQKYYAELQNNMDSSFQFLFGDEFVQAYEEQLRKLTNSRKQ